jgi:iron complex outermembrane receptor protein
MRFTAKDAPDWKRTTLDGSRSKTNPIGGPADLENLGDVRQTRWQRVVLPEQGNYGRWTADSWAPLEGRVFNGGIRLSF